MGDIVSIFFWAYFKPDAVCPFHRVTPMIHTSEHTFPKHKSMKLSLDLSLFRPLLRQVLTNMSLAHHFFQFHLQSEFLQILVQLCFGLRNLCLQPLNVALDYINVHQLFFLEHVHIARDIQVEVVAADLLE